MSSVHVVKAADPLLRVDALDALVTELLVGDDRSFALEEFTATSRRGSGDDEQAEGGAGEGDDGGVVASILNCAQSPPFMTAVRVVVVRDYEQIPAAEVAPLAAYLADPLDTTALVFVAGGGRVPKALADALKAAGAETVGPVSEKTVDVLAEAAGAAGLKLSAEASALVAAHLGDDAGRVGGLVELLAGTYGPGATLGADEVEAYLGDVGSVPVWQLTNRIDEGDVAAALGTLHRMLTATTAREPKPMHPLQVMGLLHSRYKKLLRLDDPGITTVDQAHAALGGKGSTFPTKKALEATRALGSDGLRRAIDLLHQADLDLKGSSGLPPETVIEVLVARLTGLFGRSRRSSGSRRSASVRR
ncbi:MAG: DNA polymerase III subunit delta [Acidimicrobiia bacterium]